jgi:hypothetical protein
MRCFSYLAPCAPPIYTAADSHSGTGAKSMPAVRFCSECGEQVTVKRAGFLPARSFCSHCSPRFKTARLILVASFVVCAGIAFAIGRYTSNREPFQFIGTPIDMTAERTAPAAGATGAASPRATESPTQPEQLLIAPSTTEALCGAPTKSGRPCQRKVKGGGYCWQHRNKVTEKKSPQPIR